MDGLGENAEAEEGPGDGSGGCAVNTVCNGGAALTGGAS
jgi:hypothetical protein